MTADEEESDNEEAGAGQQSGAFFLRSVAVLTATNDEALQVTGLLIKNGVRARLIQSNDGFRLINLAEIRFVFETIDAELNSPVISDSLWEKAKFALQNRYADSACLQNCMQLLDDFESTYSVKY